MNISREDAETLGSAAAYVRLHTGLSFSDSLLQVKTARDEYDITPRTYIRDRLYLVPSEALAELARKDRYVALVAEQRDSSYGRAFAVMHDIRRRYGIGFREFAQQKLYRHAEGEALTKAVRLLIEREGKHIQQVCHETGWTFEEAERRMREVKRRWPTLDFRKYVGYRLAAQSEDEITALIQRWTETAKANREKVAEITGWTVQRVQKHMTRYQILYDIIPAYYMCYRGWELTDEQMDGYARQKLSEILASRINNRADTELMGRKDKFDAIYAEFVKRKFWVNSESTFDEFLAFAEGLDSAFCKPLKSGGGLGTFTLDLTGDEVALRELYDDLMKQPLILVEESVVQHPEMNDFYPNSVNTVRVVTLQDDSGTHIISTGARFGSTGITDNFSGTGMVSDVDIATGKIVTPAVDKKGISYDAHPYSGKRFVGFQIPHWDQVIETAKRAMDVLPGVNYVGWDVAIGPDGVSLIEGNSMPDLVLVQAPYAPAKVGKRYLFDPFLERSATRRTQPSDRSSANIQEPKAASTARKTIDREPHDIMDRLRRKSRAVVRRLRKAVAPGSETGAFTDIVRDGIRFRLSDGVAAVVGHEGARGEVEVPEHVDGHPVVAIRARAFEGCVEATAFVLPESITTINSHAFAGCIALTHIEIPESVEVLNRSTFEGASALAEVGLPYGLRRIGRESFKDCVSLTTLYYYSKRGISDVMVTDRALRENALPTQLDYIGISAFENCTSLTEVHIPHLVTSIAARAFQGCSGLRAVHLHNRLQVIGARAFDGCSALGSLRLPARCKEIGAGAVDASVQIIAGRRSFAAEYAKQNSLIWREPSSEGRELGSRMNPAEPYRRFYTDEELTGVIERHEIRHPSYRTETAHADDVPGEIPDSRFTLDGDVYRGSAAQQGRARILVVGDLMARYRQQVAAASWGEGGFDASFDEVRALLAGADFVIGNLESTVSPSAPYTSEREHVNARPHLNAPPAFLGAVRRAGFDAVTHAQNHAYDSGTQGVLETLDAANQCRLMHTGLYASAADPRPLVVDIGGIRVGMVAYLDSARQMMKKANFTKTGLDTMFPYFDEEKIAADIAQARDAGAEFILAFCHWGREYTPEITERQREFARRVADAGADYIVGAHSHCVQPYEILVSEDGREVPCLWSAGNFVSDINLKPPITRDTLIMDLTLERTDGGTVVIAENGYHPCRIVHRRDGRGEAYVVVPAEIDPESTDDPEALAKARARISRVVGPGIAPVR
ncbi:CapA family protein [Microbacterium alcoholitolerans]|uniref:CapA family protein n=1 Tax=unclassified Microbacterium TaxID=2609290 RepID=UPI003D166B88